MAQVPQHATRRQKGLTLVEALVALSIVVLVSAAGASIAAASVNSMNTTRIRGFFQHEVNSLCSLYLSYEEPKFESAFFLYTGDAIVAGTDKDLYYDSSFRYVTQEDYQYRVTLAFTQEKLSVSSYRASGESIYGQEVPRYENA